MKLINLLKGIKVIREFRGTEELRQDTAALAVANNYNVSSVTADSRKSKLGCMFIAVNGAVADGHRYIGRAIDAGAQYIVCENIPEDELTLVKQNKRDEIIYIIVDNGRIAEAMIAANYYDNPSSSLHLVGVTGTNGKTSIATLLYNMFTALGYKCGLISTIANYIGETKFPTINTTPGPIDLNELINRMVAKGCEYCFMEVSSHAIDQERIAGLNYCGGIFTNITHDHLDYHKTFENYLNCKKKFFDNLSAKAFALTNIDDKNGMYMVQNTKAEIHTYSCGNAADFRARVMEQNITGMQLEINGTDVWCNFIGVYNAENLTAVYAAAILLGAPHDEVIKIMSTLHSVAGRLEYFKGSNNVIAAVDYAHTPDALENVLKTLKTLKPKGELICVFGCGGDRDKTKRPEMGAIAGKYATRIYVTSDNPRTENPLAIMEDIKNGMNQEARDKAQFIPDRIEAIRNAIFSAKPDSVILVAGKGHEDYQIIGTVKHHMDDRETVQNAFKEK